jgi:hypothetical protein
MNTRIAGTRLLLLPAGIAVALALSFFMVSRTSAGGILPVGLGTAEPFAVLAGTPAVTNTGDTVVTGNLGIHPGASVTGFPPGIVLGAIHAGDAVALQAKTDLVTAYDDAALRTPSTAVTGGILGGQNLVSGVYDSDGAIFDLTGTLTLNGQNDPSSVWIFQGSSSLVTAAASNIVFENGGSPCNVFWQITSSATLGAGSTFVGTIMALTSITMADDVTVNGRALARNGNVTLINDTISNGMCITVPIPTAAPAAPTATPFLPNTAATDGEDYVLPWPLFAVSGALALTGIIYTLMPATAGRRRRRDE